MFETGLIIVCGLISWGLWELVELIIKSLRF